MYFHICNEVNVRKFELCGNKSILIRVLEPSYSETGIPYKIENIDDYSAVLELYVQDSYQKEKDSFSYDDVIKLNCFILDNEFDEVVVHCSLGASRSPAIMICIAKIIGDEKLEMIIKNKYKIYNSFIVDLFEFIGYKKKNINNKIILGNVTDEVEEKVFFVEEDGCYVLKLR